ncbi:MAG: DapH/DapD/GlmU-related protein [Oscillospiraceae bacterium]|nr:DapH/DapD/GlmU-related protein [Oscillospiraceae bacterium]
MSEQSAIICLPDDRDATGLKKPLMLQALSGSPLLSWMVRLMRDSGYTKFLLSCDDEFRDAGLACFPASSVTATGPEPDVSVLRNFLSEAEDQLLVVTAPALLGGRALSGADAAQGAEDSGMLEGCGCYMVSAESIASVMDAANFDLGRFTSVLGTELTEADGAMPITDPGSMADFQSIFKKLRNYYLYADGVEIWDFDNCYVGPFAEVAPGAVLMPGTILKGSTTVAAGAVIGPNSLLENAHVGEDSTVNASQIYDSTIGQRTNVGPFAYVRPGCTVGDDIKVGDFVELKNSTIGHGTKISHLTYVGDTDLGQRINLGCGTVTVNYDGKSKYRCTVEDDCFIGCNTNMVAPVTIGKGSYVAAGSTITDNVPAGSLAIARERQTNKPGWADQRRKDGKLK